MTLFRGSSKDLGKLHYGEVIFVLSCFEALPGVMGNRGIMSFISGEQGNINQKMKGTGEQDNLGGGGQGTQKNNILILGISAMPCYHVGGAKTRQHKQAIVILSCFCAVVFSPLQHMAETIHHSYHSFYCLLNPSSACNELQNATNHFSQIL